MEKIFTLICCLIITVYTLTSCNNNMGSEQNNSNPTSKLPLTEQLMGESGYSISIPTDYSIKTTDGPDFIVYYFTPSDSTINGEFSGGIYLGNFPTPFEAANDSCKTEILKGEILDSLQEWTVYNCQGDYSIQTIVENKKNEDWNQNIHAFGSTKNKAGLQTILAIYSTLRKK